MFVLELRKMAEEAEVELLGKLEKIKEIRTKTLDIEKLKSRLRLELQTAETEERCVREYRSEMELLLQEKMAHVEELRLIHADINLLEATIKQSEEERQRCVNVSRAVYDEYRPLKQQVDALRGSLGMEKLADLTDGDDNIQLNLLEKSPTEMVSELPEVNSAVAMFPTNMPVAQVTVAPHRAPPTMTVNKLTEQRTPPSSAAASAAAAFRQQPPPMKACLSCHQQIHRNAPICPLCKAKSRSRNPKKPKRKLED